MGELCRGCRANRIPLGRTGRAEEAAGYVTRPALNVDGGACHVV
ncbi:MAG: hypothetical protein V7646_7943 [Pseudonocardia sp.]